MLRANIELEIRCIAAENKCTIEESKSTVEGCIHIISQKKLK